MLGESVEIRGQIVGLCSSHCVRPEIVRLGSLTISPSPAELSYWLHGFLVFQHKVSLCNPCCSGTCFVEQAGLEFIEICLPLSTGWFTVFKFLRDRMGLFSCSCNYSSCVGIYVPAERVQGCLDPETWCPILMHSQCASPV